MTSLPGITEMTRKAIPSRFDNATSDQIVESIFTRMQQTPREEFLAWVSGWHESD